MTECSRLPLVFSSVNRKKLAADFQGGDLTSDGGLPLLRGVDRRIGLIDQLSAAIPARAKRLSRSFVAPRPCPPSRTPRAFSHDSAGVLAPSPVHRFSLGGFAFRDLAVVEIVGEQPVFEEGLELPQA